MALRSVSLVELALPVRAVEPGKRQVERVSGPKSQELLLSAIGCKRDDHRTTILVAADMKPVRSEFDRLTMRYTQGSVAMFVLLIILQIGIVRLALLSQRLRRSRESLGNLAHALKAPLTVLTHMATDAHVQRDPMLARRMSEQLEMLRGRIDSELRRARVAGARTTSPALDLSSEIAALVATLRKMHRERDLDIECLMEPGIPFIGNREDLQELSGNLLDNACKWARSRVRVTVREGRGMTLTVEDDGPGTNITVTAGYVDGASHPEFLTRAPKTVSAPGNGDFAITLLNLGAPLGASTMNPLTTLVRNAISLGSDESGMALTQAILLARSNGTTLDLTDLAVIAVLLGLPAAG